MNRRAGEHPRQYCREVLPFVSRTFALSIGVLPDSLRDTVTVSYLLCRMADVLEDATWSDPGRRVTGLDGLARAVADPVASAEDLAASLSAIDGLDLGGGAGERLVRERLEVFHAYKMLPAGDREIVSRWLGAMAFGMASFVERERRSEASLRLSAADTSLAGSLAPAVEAIPFVLNTVEELTSYAYYVAGTVGCLLTELFERRLGDRIESDALRRLAVPFGLGLQFTNILQDLAEDRRRGWCYIPEELARRYGTTVHAWEDPGEHPAALRVVGALVDTAASYLDRAFEYVLLLPRKTPRLRLFCLWPTLFALRTLSRLWGEEQVLTGGDRVRISRREVRRIIGTTSLLCMSDQSLRWLFSRERRRLRRRMEAGAGVIDRVMV